ncbi:MAG: hypothetical protein ACYTG7_24855, partial [Planctomycetota bacterium]
VEAKVDPVWLMGSSAFAFRIFVNEIMCPSAMSIFKWSTLLPEAVEHAGRQCIYISRLWDEGEKEEAKRAEAHEAIVQGIDEGRPAVAWDVADAEWGLIIGYDEKRKSYDTLTCKGKPDELAYDKLGKNGIDVLSVAIPAGPNERSQEEIILKSLHAAVAHAEQKEWMDRPKYQDGLPAYDLWGLLLDRWIQILQAGRAKEIKVDILHFSAYYAAHYYSARCYARDYLNAVSSGIYILKHAALSYKKVASSLAPLWEFFSKGEPPKANDLFELRESLRSAREAEALGIEQIKEYLARAR